MIGLLITDVLTSQETSYFSKFSNKIFTDNRDVNFLDHTLLNDANSLENLLNQHNISCLLSIKKNEKIKVLNLENIETKSNRVCLTDKKWILKAPRFFSNKTNKAAAICQNIIITQEEKIEYPILDDDFHILKNLYKEKKYQQFVVESEKWIFHNLEKTQKQLMLRYYCGLVYYFKLQNIKKSLEHLGIALLINPGMPELWCAWGDILLDKKMYEKSKYIYKNAIISQKARNIFDNYPLWLDRNSGYAENMYKKIKESVKNIKTVRSIYDF